MPYGEYQYSLDDKGRVVVPQSFRHFVEDGVVVTRGMEGCLYLFPLIQWIRIEEQLNKAPIGDAESRAFVRFFYSGAYKTKMDNAYRVMVPPALRKFADVESEVVIAGAPGHLELWSEKRWWENINKILENPPAPEALRGLVG